MDHLSLRSSIFLGAFASSLYLTWASTTEPPDDDDDFFDHDNNKAMFLVLPAMILIYGGCGLIYCIHKCRRYCLNRKKEKKKAEKRRRKELERQSFSNAVTNIADERQPMTRGDSQLLLTSQGSATLTLECLDGDHDHDTRASRNATRQETDVDSLEDVLQTENVRAVSPGYQDTNGRDVHREMQHLDNQLKAAFRLTKTDGLKTGFHDKVSDSAINTKKTVESDLNVRKDHPDVQTETQATDISPASQSTRRKKRRQIVDSEGSDHLNAIPMEDLKSIVAVRNTISKEAPKSMPDKLKRPDENTIELRKVKLPDGKRVVLLSSQ